MDIIERIDELIELGNDYKQDDDVDMYYAWKHNVLDFVGNELAEDNLKKDLESLFDSYEVDSEQKIFEILDRLKKFFQSRFRINELVFYSSVYNMLGVPLNSVNSLMQTVNQLDSIEAIIEYNWNKYSGIGVALGNKDYIALEFDGITVAISDLLTTLDLPSDYEWVTLNNNCSSNFVLLFRSEEILKFYNLHKEHSEYDSIEIYGPEENIDLRDAGLESKKIILHFADCVALPTSNDPEKSPHFRGQKIPKSEPYKLNILNIDRLFSKYCSRRQFSSYNTKEPHRDFELTETKKIHLFLECDGRPSIYCENDPIPWLESVNEGEALNSLAIRYLMGKGVERNSIQAIRLLKKSNTQSSAFNLISLYSVGLYKAEKKTIFNLCRRLDIDNIKSHINLIESNLGYQLPISKNILFIDTETTGLAVDQFVTINNVDNWPRIVQLSWVLTDFSGNIKSEGDYVIKPNGFRIPEDATKIHGITNESATEKGYDLLYILSLFKDAVNHADLIIGHNVDFDKNVIIAELMRLGRSNILKNIPSYCTMKNTVDYCKIVSFRNKYRYPGLQELYFKLFNRNFENAHDSFADVKATKDCFFKLLDDDIIDITNVII